MINKFNDEKQNRIKEFNYPDTLHIQFTQETPSNDLFKKIKNLKKNKNGITKFKDGN